MTKQLTKDTEQDDTKTVNGSKIAAKTVKETLAIYSADADDRIAKLTQRVDALEQANAGANKIGFSLPTFSEFKSFMQINLYRLIMAALLLYCGYSLINSDVVKKFFNGKTDIKKKIDNDKKTDLSGSIKDISQRYADNLTSDKKALATDLDQLAKTIDDSVNPASELRPVIQHEEAQWRDAVGDKFRREYAGGAKASALVKEIAAGLR